MHLFAEIWYHALVRFHASLLRQAQAVRDALVAASAFAGRPTVEGEGRFKDRAKAADEAGRVLTGELDEAVGGPGAGREEAFMLGRALELLLSCVRGALDDMGRLQVPADAVLAEMAQACAEAGTSLASAVRDLGDPARSGELVVAAKRAANRAEHAARKGMKELFHNEPDAVATLKVREVYKRFSDAALHADRAADCVADMLVKAA